MDDALLVRMLDGLTYQDKELEPLGGIEPVLIAVAGDGDPLDQFHHEKRPATLSGATIEHLGDIGVVH